MADCEYTLRIMRIYNNRNLGTNITIPASELISGSFEIVANQVGSLVFKLGRHHTYYDTIKNIYQDFCFVEKRNRTSGNGARYIFVGKLAFVDEDENCMTKTYTFADAYSFLSDVPVIASGSSSVQTGRARLVSCLTKINNTEVISKPYDLNVGKAEFYNSTTSTVYNDSPVYESFEEWLTRLNTVETKISSNYSVKYIEPYVCSVTHKGGEDYTQFNVNLVSDGEKSATTHADITIRQSDVLYEKPHEEYYNLITGVLPLGKKMNSTDTSDISRVTLSGSSLFLRNTSKTSAHGDKIEVVVFDAIEKATELRTAAQAYLNSRIKLSYHKYTDLKLKDPTLNGSGQVIQVGSYAKFTDKNGVETIQVVTRIKVDLLKEKIIELTLGLATSKANPQVMQREKKKPYSAGGL